MITIKEIDKNDVELKIDKETTHTTLLLGLEMLIEMVVEETKMNIDDVLSDVKKIYERDNIKK